MRYTTFRQQRQLERCCSGKILHPDPAADDVPDTVPDKVPDDIDPDTVPDDGESPYDDDREPE